MAVPVTLAEARRQLKLEEDDTSQDAELGDFIADAVDWVERYTGHIMAARDVTAVFGSFGGISFREWPIAPSAVPIVTYDAGSTGAAQVTDVRVVASRRPVRVVPWIGSRWPTVTDGTAVTVTLRAGYEASDVVPSSFRRAILMLVAAYDADREGGDIIAKAEATARTILRDFRFVAL